MQGLFLLSDLAAASKPLGEPRCGACGLFRTCESPKMPVTGRGGRKILIVAEAPGAEEDRLGRQLVGNSGQELEKYLARHGCRLREDCWLTNSVICFTGDTTVESPSPVRRLFRRRYTGPLVRVQTFGGRFFTGTPNHPMLTPGGWVALGLLNEGDDLVCHDRFQRPGGGGPDVENPPARFDQVFDAATEFGNVQRVVGSRLDFHGDGEDGDVDVVCTDRFLRDGLKTSLDQQGSQSPLESSDELIAELFGQGGSGSDPVPLLGRPLAASGGFVGGGGQRLSAFGPESFVADGHGRGFVANGNPAPLEKEFQPVKGDAEAVGQRLQSLPGVVSTDRVVKIEVYSQQQLLEGDDRADGACHVYNLETEDGFYIVAGGIVASNCRPPGNEMKDAYVDHCRPNLVRTLEELKPEVIILLGGVACRSLLEWVTDFKVDAVTKWVGWQIPDQKLNAWVHPTFHPAYLLREERKQPVLGTLFDAHLAAALKKTRRPWKEKPDFPGQVEVEMDDRRAARFLRDCRRAKRPVAFDFETTTLKPHGPHARLWSCAVSWEGERTVAYPWRGAAVDATWELLHDERVPKVGYNAKFEQAWTVHFSGKPVANWVIDGMQAAHVLDNRRGVTGLDFQAYVRLGQPDWSKSISPFLKAKTRRGNAPNSVHKAPLEDLLKYNGLDALLEYKLGVIMAKELDIPLE